MCQNDTRRELELYALGARLNDALMDVHGLLLPKFLHPVLYRRRDPKWAAFTWAKTIQVAALGVLPLANEARYLTDNQIAALIPRTQSLLDIARAMRALLARGRRA
jgi:hypothetical protein